MAKGEVQRGRFVADDEEPRLINDGTLVEPEVSDEEAAYLNFRESLKAGEEMPTLRVSKVPKSGIGNPMHAKLIYCFACPVDQYGFEELCEYVRESYGGGLYRLMATQKGKRGTLFNQLLNIAEAVQTKRNPDGAPNPNGNVSAIMESVATMLAQSQERTEALLTRMGLVGGVPATQVDPLAMFEKFAGVLAVVQKMTAPAAAPQTDLLTELNKLAALKGVLGGILGGGDSDGGGSAAETNFYDTINQTLKTVAPALAAAIGAKGGFPALAPPAPVAPAQPDPGQPPATPPQPTAAQVNLKKQVDVLVMQAKSGATAEDVAEMVLNMTPEARYAELYDFINRPTVVNEMQAVNAEVANHREFFDKLRGCILLELGPEESPAQPTT